MVIMSAVGGEGVTTTVEGANDTRSTCVTCATIAGRLIVLTVRSCRR